VLQFVHNKWKFPYVVLRDIAGIILEWQKGKVKKHNFLEFYFQSH
jgi:hypothetical protein